MSNAVTLYEEKQGLDEDKLLSRTEVHRASGAQRRLAEMSVLLPQQALIEVARSLLRGVGTPTSALQYASDLKRFFAWCATRSLDPRDARRDDLIEYQDAIKGYSLSSQKRLMTVVRVFYRELVAREMVARNPAEQLPKIKGDDAYTPAGYSEEEVAQLLSLIEAETRSDDYVRRHHAIRDYAIVHLAVSSGLRAAELVGLRWGDIARTGRYDVVTVRRGKGRKSRQVPLRENTLKALFAYDAAMETLGVRFSEGDPVFVRLNWDLDVDVAPMTTRNLHYLITKWLGAAGLRGKRQAVHQLRRTMATVAHDRGVPVEDIAHDLGHQDSRTTINHYIKPADQLKRSGVHSLPW